MRVDGEWFECDDAFIRPIIRAEVLNVQGGWVSARSFLVDTGADCTVFSGAILEVLGFDADTPDHRLGGVGGVVESVRVPTEIRLFRDDGQAAVFRGEYAAFTQLESLDISILGRDIIELFALIVDRDAAVVSLVRPPHRYLIESP
ncbi:MAG: hypothetical protein R3C19_03860 [Planctomycetaceae bacterium]